MGYEPRMRGRRFRRPAAKKTAARHKRTEPNAPYPYQEREQGDLFSVRANTLNALEHLGSQRFALPPYSEHFQRWLKDVRSVLTEFEARLSREVDQEYRAGVEKALSKVEGVLTERTGEERRSSDETASLQQRLTMIELEISKLDQEYKAQTREIRRRHEKSMERLRQEIDSLDKERGIILRKRATFWQRIFGTPRSTLERYTNALQSKRIAMEDRKNLLTSELEKRSRDYQTKRKRLIEEQEAPRGRFGELREKEVDDAVEIRKETCRELAQAVTEVFRRLREGQQP